MDWSYIWFGLAVVEAVMIIALASAVLEQDEARRDMRIYLEDHRREISRLTDWLYRRNVALRKITALDTPNAAHGVKKAVKIAEEALK